MNNENSFKRILETLQEEYQRIMEEKDAFANEKEPSFFIHRICQRKELQNKKQKILQSQQMATDIYKIATDIVTITAEENRFNNQLDTINQILEKEYYQNLLDRFNYLKYIVNEILFLDLQPIYKRNSLGISKIRLEIEKLYAEFLGEKKLAKDPSYKEDVGTENIEKMDFTKMKRYHSLSEVLKDCLMKNFDYETYLYLAQLFLIFEQEKRKENKEEIGNLRSSLPTDNEKSSEISQCLLERKQNLPL